MMQHTAHRFPFYSTLYIAHCTKWSTTVLAGDYPVYGALLERSWRSSLSTATSHAF